MSDTSDNAKAKLKAARLKAEQLRAMQEEAALEIAEAEALEAGEIRKKEIARAQAEKERLHRSSEKQRLLKEKQRAAYEAREEAAVRAKVAGAAGASVDSSTVSVAEDDHDFEDDDFDDDDTFEDVPSSRSKSQRKRLGLRCFNCNRLEGHYLSYYRRVWYSFLVGMSFGIAVILGPYKCQCCGSQRLMISNLLHPKYYAAISRTRGKSSSKRKSSRR